MVDPGMLIVKWSELRRGRSSSERALPAADPSLGVWLALSEGGGLRVLLALEEGERDPVVDVGASGALSCTTHELTVGGEVRRCVDLACRVSTLDGMFRIFTQALLGQRLSGRGASESLETTVKEFCDLLGLGAQGGRHRNLGDLGELLVLSWLQAVSPSAIEAWTGPATGRHDFLRGQSALEVKTGLRPHGQVRIAKLEQLEAPQDGSLWLVVVTVEADADGDLKVAELARAADAKVPLGALVQPEARLKLDALSALGERNAYSLYETRVYRIDEDTPRLRESMLVDVPSSVRGVSYSLDLEELEDWLVPPEDHPAIWERLT